MKIISLHIVAFGKLKDVTLNFQGGINVIKETNSFGKTTVAGFIRAMLYGLAPARSKDINNVSHFAPWDGADKFGGSMVVEQEGETYRIERFFRANSRQESLTVTNDKTGKTMDFTQQPGEVLLGLTAESYDRSAYFPQEAVALAPNENLDSRLANLVEDSAEDYDTVQKKLQAYKKSLRYERGQGGAIYEIDCQKIDLNNKLYARQNAEKRAVEIDKRLADIEQEKQALSAKQAQYNEQLTALQNAPKVEAVVPNIPPQQQTGSSKIVWLCVGIALALAGLVFVVLGIAKVMDVVGYIVGVICLALGIGGIAIYCTHKILAKRATTTPTPQQVEQVDNSDKIRNLLNMLTDLGNQANNLAWEQGRLAEERKGLSFDSVEIREQLLALDEQRKDAVHRYEVAEIVVKLLEQAKDNLSSSYLPKLCASCTQMLQDITQSNMSVVIDRNFAVSIREQGQTKPIAEFSRGIREITLLCFRVALSQLLYDGAIPFVIVDDAFVNFDENNFVRATNLLKQLSTHAQVIYFTCHDRMGNLLK